MSRIEGGAYYCQGSFQRLPDALVAAPEGYGGGCCCGARVRRIETCEGRVAGSSWRTDSASRPRWWSPTRTPCRRSLSWWRRRPSRRTTSPPCARRRPPSRASRCSWPCGPRPGRAGPGPRDVLLRLPGIRRDAAPDRSRAAGEPGHQRPVPARPFPGPARGARPLPCWRWPPTGPRPPGAGQGPLRRRRTPGGGDRPARLAPAPDLRGRGHPTHDGTLHPQPGGGLYGWEPSPDQVAGSRPAHRAPCRGSTWPGTGRAPEGASTAPSPPACRRRSCSPSTRAPGAPQARLPRPDPLTAARSAVSTSLGTGGQRAGPAGRHFRDAA